METTISDLVKKYGQQIGQINSRTSFMHSEPAAAAAAELRQIQPQYTNLSGYNFIFRIGQVLGDARFFAAVGHNARDCYWFSPAVLNQ